MKVKFIYNPYSGDCKIASYLDDIIHIYQSSGYTIIPHRTTSDPDHLSVGLKDIDSSYHHILIAGGDGTINSVVNYVKAHGIDVPLAFLPTGTANDFAKMLGFGNDILKNCRNILDGDISYVDLGKIDNKYFVNVFSTGLFTDASQKTPTVLKNTFGKLAYYFSSIQDLPSFRKLKLKIESKEYSFEDSALILFVFNGNTAGNLKLAHKSDVEDGLLDVLIVKGKNIVETINTIFRVLLMHEIRKYPSDIIHFQTDRLTIECENDIPTDIDGENGPAFPLEISCEHKALKIIRPAKEK